MRPAPHLGRQAAGLLEATRSEEFFDRASCVRSSGADGRAAQGASETVRDARSVCAQGHDLIGPRGMDNPHEVRADSHNVSSTFAWERMTT